METGGGFSDASRPLPKPQFTETRTTALIHGRKAPDNPCQPRICFDTGHVRTPSPASHETPARGPSRAAETPPTTGERCRQEPCEARTEPHTTSSATAGRTSCRHRWTGPLLLVGIILHGERPRYSGVHSEHHHQDLIMNPRPRPKTPLTHKHSLRRSSTIRVKRAEHAHRETQQPRKRTASHRQQ